MEFIIIYPPAYKSKERMGIYKNMPFGGLYIAEGLLRNGYNVSIIDESLEDCFAELKKQISKNTIAIGISSMSGLQLDNALNIAEYIKKHWSNIPIIFGGAHSTALPHQTLNCELIDYVVWGEGEQSLPLLLKKLKEKGKENLEYKELENINGIGYKIQDKAIVNKAMGYTPLHTRTFNLPYHLLNMENYYRPLSIGVDRAFQILTSRGCPFRCKYCSNSSDLWPNTKVRYHTIEHIINDIQILNYEYNADCITFADEIFVFNEDRIRDICNAIINSKLNYIKYRASSRVDTFLRLKNDTLEIMKKAGFVGFNIGIESGSEKVLSIIGKKYKLDDIYSADAILSEHQFYKSYNFMTCIPGESLQDVQKTVNLQIDLAANSKYCPYPISALIKYLPLPNTKLFDITVQHGWQPFEDIWGWTKLISTVEDSTKNIHTWVDDQIWNYIHEVNEHITYLNSLFIGSKANHEQIDNYIHKIKSNYCTCSELNNI